MKVFTTGSIFEPIRCHLNERLFCYRQTETRAMTPALSSRGRVFKNALCLPLREGLEHLLTALGSHGESLVDARTLQVRSPTIRGHFVTGAKGSTNNLRIVPGIERELLAARSEVAELVAKVREGGHAATVPGNNDPLVSALGGHLQAPPVVDEVCPQRY